MDLGVQDALRCGVKVVVEPPGAWPRLMAAPVWQVSGGHVRRTRAAYIVSVRA